MKTKGFIYFVTILLIGLFLISSEIPGRIINKNLNIGYVSAKEPDVEDEEGYNEQLYVYPENKDENEDFAPPPPQEPEEGEYLEIPGFEYNFGIEDTNDISDTNIRGRDIINPKEKVDEETPGNINLR